MSNTHCAERHALAFMNDPSQANRDQVVYASEPIIRSIISRIALPSDDLARAEDLYNVGVLAVLQALDQYDSDAGARFITFAYPRIRGEIIDYLRRIDPLPRRRRAKVARVKHAHDRLAQQMGAEPNEELVAEALETSVHEIRITQCDAQRRYGEHLFDEKSTEEGLTLIDLMPDRSAGDGFDEMEWEDVRDHLGSLSDVLSERDRLVVELYFTEDMTLSEIGLILGVSEARVSQLRKCALHALGKGIDAGLRLAA